MNFEMSVPVNDRSIKAGQTIGSCIRTRKKRLCDGNRKAQGETF